MASPTREWRRTDYNILTRQWQVFLAGIGYIGFFWNVLYFAGPRTNDLIFFPNRRASPVIAHPARTFQLNSLSDLDLHHVQAELVTYRGRHAVRLVEQAEPSTDDHAIAILSGSDFKDGVIETEIAGAPRKDAPKICAASSA